LAGDLELRQRRAGLDASFKNGLGLDVLARRQSWKVIVGAGRVERHVDEACVDRQIAPDMSMRSTNAGDVSMILYSIDM
jgi:hypothetical protein